MKTINMAMKKCEGLQRCLVTPNTTGGIPYRRGIRWWAKKRQNYKKYVTAQSQKLKRILSIKKKVSRGKLLNLARKKIQENNMQLAKKNIAAKDHLIADLKEEMEEMEDDIQVIESNQELANETIQELTAGLNYYFQAYLMQCVENGVEPEIFSESEDEDE